MVETQFCKLRGTSDTFVQHGFCELNIRYEMITHTQFYTNYRPRVFCFIMKDTYRPVTPLDAARVKQDDFA